MEQITHTEKWGRGVLYSRIMLKLWLEKIYELLNRCTGGIPAIIKDTIDGFTPARAAQAAAGLA